MRTTLTPPECAMTSEAVDRSFDDIFVEFHDVLHKVFDAPRFQLQLLLLLLQHSLQLLLLLLFFPIFLLLVVALIFLIVLFQTIFFLQENSANLVVFDTSVAGERLDINMKNLDIASQATFVKIKTGDVAALTFQENSANLVVFDTSVGIQVKMLHLLLTIFTLFISTTSFVNADKPTHKELSKMRNAADTAFVSGNAKGHIHLCIRLP